MKTSPCCHGLSERTRRGLGAMRSGEVLHPCEFPARKLLSPDEAAPSPIHEHADPTRSPPAAVGRALFADTRHPGVASPGIEADPVAPDPTFVIPRRNDGMGQRLDGL